ncbi:ribonuclease T2 family protein [Photobacterium aquae]|uniref:ribonuclease T2 family protein n=1 Tax=Photobacterium aquae TaxID=1195763 RepID=UPI00069DBF4F|nr:hypothetical protein [Photobacterium aquae]
MHPLLSVFSWTRLSSTQARYAACILISGLALPSTGLASVKIDTHFQATQACPAYQSFRKQSNPNNIHTQTGTRYQAYLLNKPDGDWVQLKFNDATPPLRWVNRSCGQLGSISSPPANVSTKTTNHNNKQCDVANQHDSYVLAVSWQRGFCEHSNAANNKPECKALNNNTLSIDHLTLHGLWPNRASCGIKYGYCDPNNKLSLKPSTIDAIAPWMPNFLYQQDFGAYQWKKHGACQALDDDSYFLLAADLVKRVDASAIGQYIKHNAGERISVKKMQTELQRQLGQDTVRRIQLSCLKKRYLQEVRISLPLDIENNSSLETMLGQAKPMKNFRGNCSATIVIED